jgi:hypothetical protein
MLGVERSEECQDTLTAIDRAIDASGASGAPPFVFHKLGQE